MSQNQTEEFDYKEFLRNASSQPGVYQMYNHEEQVIYVGKAKNLKKRLASYFSKAHNDKTLALVSQINHIDITITASEGGALLLEDSLIKQHQPRYNILLRDDKSYPYIYLSTQQDYPQISIYRGSTHNKPGTFFGPYPAASAVRQSLHLLHKLFRIRQCNDSYFKNRSRPCLQYQIKRCSAPCVGLISKDDYQQDISLTELFLGGKTEDVINSLVDAMQQASDNLAYEKAAQYRNQVQQLRLILEKQYIYSDDKRDIDILACAAKGGQACIQVFYFRNGRNLGNKAFFPKLPDKYSDAAEILEAFISQYYLSHEIPDEIISSHSLHTIDLLTTVLCEKSGKSVTIKTVVRSERAKWMGNAKQNAIEALNMHLARKSSFEKQVLAVQSLLDMDDAPRRIECFDVSHTQGRETVASCVVFDASGPVNSEYRRYNIRDITPGDDYAAMSQVLERRYSRVIKEQGSIPDLILLDGGKGQLSRALDTLEPLFGVNPMIAAISKGPDRKPGMELIHIAGKNQPIEISRSPSASLLLQQIRDEAHRFAITGHRLRARKQSTKSPLESIQGLGPKRRQLLLQSFGGIHGINRAGIDDLKSIKGISHNLAVRIYEYLHSH